MTMRITGRLGGLLLLTLTLASLAGGRSSARILTAAVPAGAVTTFAGNAQHTAVYLPAAADLNTIRWSAPIDLNPSARLAHFGAPVITAANTVIIGVKTASDGFQVRALSGEIGAQRYPPLATDYILPAHNWIPVFNPAIATFVDRATGRSVTRLYYAGAGGTVFTLDDPDNPLHAAPVRQAFYGLAAYQANTSAFNTSVFINTPITPDSAGNIFFGFRVQGTAPAPLATTQSGYARIAPDGTARFVLTGVASATSAITVVPHNSAPALSRAEDTLYVVVRSGTTSANGFLLGLDATTLATKYKVFLRDPRNGGINNASIPDDSTSSPMVAPDDDVYFGVFANPNNGSRGFLLRFSADLTIEKTPGAFGWDSTAAIVPATMAPLYHGASPYLIFTKYNNYTSSDGDGINRIALLDPNATQIDPHPTANNLIEMAEVLTVAGPTPDDEKVSPAFPSAVREWCINTAAVNPATQSIFTPSEDGRIYRWSLATNSLSQGVRLTPGIGEPYVPTVIGPDGTVFTLNGGTIFAVGSNRAASLTLTSSNPDLRAVVAGQPLTFTARMTGSRVFQVGAVTFTDVHYQDQILTPASTVLARVPLTGGIAAYNAAALAAGTHFITASYEGGAPSVTLVQKVHLRSTTTNVVASTAGSPAGTVTLTATVTSPGGGVPTGMVSFQEGARVLLQVPLARDGTAVVVVPGLSTGVHTFAAIYASDALYAASNSAVSATVTSGVPESVQRR